jgi:hypothetical protein
MNDFIASYRIGVAYLIHMGFTEHEAANLASLRLAYLMYREAFM